MADFIKVRFEINDHEMYGDPVDERCELYAEVTEEHDATALRSEAEILNARLAEDVGTVEFCEVLEGHGGRKHATPAILHALREYLAEYPHWDYIPNTTLSGPLELRIEGQCQYIDGAGSRCRRFGQMYAEVPLSSGTGGRTIAVRLCRMHIGVAGLAQEEQEGQDEGRLEQRCQKCGKPVVVARDQYEVFERMHWTCFHFEYEHLDDAGSPADPDEPCADPSCPWGRLRRMEDHLRSLGVAPGDL